MTDGAELAARTIRSGALRLQRELRGGRVTPNGFATVLQAIPPRDRDEWLSALLGVDDVPPDDPGLPRGCVPYLPCDAATVLESLRLAGVADDDVFIDVGAGVGRAAFLARLVTGATAIGVEIQASLVRTARARADWLNLDRVTFVRGDAAELIDAVAAGTVFFLYCPFGAEHLRRFLDALEDVSRSRLIRVCCVDMPPLEAPWLTRVPTNSLRVDVYRSKAPRASPAEP